MGYSGQNPYVMGRGGSNPFQDKFQRELRKAQKEAKDAKLSQEITERRCGPSTGTEGDQINNDKRERMGGAAAATMGRLIDIDAIIDEHDREEEERMRIARERHWKDSDGLLTGEMV